MRRTSWRERVTMDSRDPRLLGEDEDGYLVVPVPGQPGRWQERFDASNRRHWPCYLRTRLRRRMAMVERGAG